MKGRIILAGGSGFLGSRLARHFHELGWDVVLLTRNPKDHVQFRSMLWNARTIGAWTSEFEKADVVVNLTGRSVDCRYNAKNRSAIMDSRVESTRVIGEAIARCKSPPRIWLNASTATLYKHTFGPAWDETGEIGAVPEAHDAFSIEVGQAWEDALKAAEAPRTRKVMLRTAMVLGCAPNSVFPVLRRLVRLGLGGRAGTGRQWVSWIHEEDFCRAVHGIIEHEELDGVVNLCAPNPLPNAEMMRVLRRIFRVPTGLPAPRWMLEIGAFFLRTETELVLKSRRVIPGTLLKSGFEFRFPTFAEAAGQLNSL